MSQLFHFKNKFKGDAIEQRKSAERLIGAIQTRHREAFTAVFQTIEKEQVVRRYVEMSNTSTPFSNSAQHRKDMGENVRQLKACIENVATLGVAAWVGPAKSMAAFVTKLVDDATSLVEKAACASIHTELAMVKLALTDFREVVDNCPNPEEDDKPFQTFMRKNGVKMNDHVKTAEKVFILREVRRARGQPSTWPSGAAPEGHMLSPRASLS
jgi:hypothetical protein